MRPAISALQDLVVRCSFRVSNSRSFSEPNRWAFWAFELCALQPQHPIVVLLNVVLERPVTGECPTISPNEAVTHVEQAAWPKRENTTHAIPWGLDASQEPEIANMPQQQNARP
eukprot:3562261-Amphidinium_carterae.2